MKDDVKSCANNNPGIRQLEGIFFFKKKEQEVFL